MAAESPPRPLGRTGVDVTPLCFGGAPLSGMPQNFGYDVSEERAAATLHAILEGPVNFLDTSANYGSGRGEQRIGAALRARGGPPAGFVVATKADGDDGTGDFSGAQVRRCAERSLRRLGLDRFPLYHLHDPEHLTFEEGMAPGGPVEEMLRLKEEGIAGSLGVAGGPVDLMIRYVETGAFDVVLTHNRYTLLDRSADRLLDVAARHGVAVLNAAPFAGGVLAKGPRRQPRYVYRAMPEPVRERLERLAALCGEAGVPLAAVALQFSLREPRIASTVVGVSTPERVRRTLDLAAVPVPDDLWSAAADCALPPELQQDADPGSAQR
ncbi:oxidoreductase [Streptomyces sulfonofaciens]|uniref:Oxidoreductase n=1 Tax=Streptomyces sulfonofaciens TaxID=68272 RepID=A0A919L6B9_9ACTN|nr:oxidoreductase [Streptomyces sulfonofaciens]